MPEKEKKKRKQENFEVIMTENFPKLIGRH